MIYYSLFTLANANGVEATVSNTEIVAGNMAQLKIKAIGNRAAFPNITEIGGAKVLGRHENQNNSFTYINGEMKSERSTILVLTFAPQKDMTIPSYAVNIDGTVYKTKPIDLKVVKSNVPTAGSNSKFSLQLRTDKKSVVVGEPFLVTVYFSLQNGIRLSENPQYNKPEFKGFFSKEIGEDKNYREGKRQVTELRYILTPKAEGNYTLGPATAKIGVADRSRRDMFGRFFGTNWHPIVSNALDIEVKGKVQDTDLVGDISLESSIDKQEVKANKPVNLTVKMSGEGSLEDFEFPAYEIDGVTIYSDDAKITTDLHGNSIKSSYVKSFAFIADHDFIIPARSISVYDIKTQTVKQLKVPEYKVSIKGNTSVVASVPKVPKAQSGKVQTNLEVPVKSMLDGEEAVVVDDVTPASWWMIALAFVSGLLVMSLVKMLPKLKRGKRYQSYKESDALKILYPHINESKALEAMVRKLYAKKAGNKEIIIDKKELNMLIDQVQGQMI
jgi:hypothetical protein